MTNKNKLDTLKTELKKLKAKRKLERTDEENLRIAELEIAVKKRRCESFKK